MEHPERHLMLHVELHEEVARFAECFTRSAALGTTSGDSWTSAGRRAVIFEPDFDAGCAAVPAAGWINEPSAARRRS